MTMIFPLLMLVLMVGIFASLMREGLWSNLLTLINVTFAALLATNFFEPLATKLTEYVPKGTMFWDMVAIWGIFALAYLVFRSATMQASKWHIKFKKPIDMGGGYFFALWTAYLFMAFTTVSLHTAPLSREPLWSGFRVEDPIFFGMKPDRQWLAFVQLVSRGSLARMVDENQPELHVFDPRGEFMPKYSTRRDRYSQMDTLTGLP